MLDNVVFVVCVVGFVIVVDTVGWYLIVVMSYSCRCCVTFIVTIVTVTISFVAFVLCISSHQCCSGLPLVLVSGSGRTRSTI